jgi:DNA-binding CsgD family transcriptional regulator
LVTCPQMRPIMTSGSRHFSQAGSKYPRSEDARVGDAGHASAEFDPVPGPGEVAGMDAAMLEIGVVGGRQVAHEEPAVEDPSAIGVALRVTVQGRLQLAEGVEGPATEASYREAIDRLSRTPVRPELARADLLFGEWLRREGRRVDAREQLRTAHDMCLDIGMDAFAERARRELVATGEKVRRRGSETRDELTPQEEQIARLARDGLSNPEIGAQLFISARTVEWHLRKVYAKLGIHARAQLRAALPEETRLPARV